MKKNPNPLTHWTFLGSNLFSILQLFLLLPSLLRLSHIVLEENSDSKIHSIFRISVKSSFNILLHLTLWRPSWAASMASVYLLDEYKILKINTSNKFLVKAYLRGQTSLKNIILVKSIRIFYILIGYWMNSSFYFLYALKTCVYSSNIC